MLLTDQQYIYRSASEINSGMLRVYNNMLLAVVTSLIVSLLVASSSALMTFFFTGFMKWIVIFAPLVAVFAIGMALANNPPKPIALAMLHGFAALMGLSTATIFHTFTLGSITSAFMGAAVLFGTLSFYGYFTKQNLHSLGRYLLIALIAIIIASIINIFIGNSMFQTIISAAAIVIFLGLTAYDTQQIREELSVEGNNIVEVTGALRLYLNFINIFISLLQLTGTRQE
jgi:FtsH-binding integral membrane protein